MTPTRERLLSRLQPDYRVEQRGADLFHIVEDHGEPLDVPIELWLEEDVLDEYLARLVQHAGADDVDEAPGLVRVYVQEDVESSIVAGARVIRLGVTRDEATGEVSWFSERPPEPPQADHEGDLLEWRRD